ncbi:MAG: NAD(P)H-binding protein [Sciscionella sp.]
MTGATGNVGRNVVSELLADGTAVRAFVRDPDSADLPKSVETVGGDLSKPSTVSPFLDGVDAVFLLWPFLDASDGAELIDVVGEQVHRIVYLSSLGIRDDLERQTNPINGFHAEMEHMIERSGLAWTFLRCSMFAKNLLGHLPEIRAEGVLRGPYGAAVRSPIHERDIAAVAARTLTRDGHAGKRYRLTGPQAMNAFEQVRVLAEAVGRPLRFEETSRAAARRDMLSWLPEPGVDEVLDALAEFVTEPEPVTSAVWELTGASARTLHSWALDHADVLR